MHGLAAGGAAGKFNQAYAGLPGVRRAGVKVNPVALHGKLRQQCLCRGVDVADQAEVARLR
jgi:uncharacterized spore protein YtfJ